MTDLRVVDGDGETTLRERNADRKLLVVDDDDMVRTALSRTLRSAGYQVFEAPSGEAALSLLGETRVDIVVSDHLMPDMTGLELLKCVHDRHPDALRVIVTGHAEMNVAIEAINQGEVYRFITKPWDNTELKVMIHIAFEQLELERRHRRLLAAVRTDPTLYALLDTDVSS